MAAILEKIVREKKKEVAFLKKSEPLEKLLVKKRAGKKAHAFYSALRAGKTGPAVIAEIKRKSPSKGILRKNFNAVSIARSYQINGAAALSVLTDRKFFGAPVKVLQKVSRASRLPLLRKDFMVDAYQIWESKLMGADAVLLIAAALSAAQMKGFYALATKLGMDTLFEVHDDRDVKKILKLSPKIVGINNRNLKNFKVDIKTTERLLKKHAGFFKNKFVVSESGIKTNEDLRRLKKMGVDAVLIGESFMVEKDPGLALKRMMRHDTR